MVISMSNGIYDSELWLGTLCMLKNQECGWRGFRVYRVCLFTMRWSCMCLKHLSVVCSCLLYEDSRCRLPLFFTRRQTDANHNWHNVLSQNVVTTRLISAHFVWENTQQCGWSLNIKWHDSLKINPFYSLVTYNFLLDGGLCSQGRCFPYWVYIQWWGPL